MKNHQQFSQQRQPMKVKLTNSNAITETAGKRGKETGKANKLLIVVV